MKRLRVLALLWGLVAGGAVAAQEGVWVQVEALPTLTAAQDRVRDYAGDLPDVVGYALTSGWYGIAIGPYSRDDASAVLRQLRASGAIPGDSYIVTGSTFRQQFWPIGAGAPVTAQPLPEGLEPSVEVTETAPLAEVAEPEPEPAPVVDETPAQARQSEALLTREEKMELQVWLQWAGFYEGAIDGAYGRGTRGSMAAWQGARGYEETGVLTTRQRAELYAEYNAVLEGMDLAPVRDAEAGIEMIMPTGAVAFSTYAPPFARYEPVSPDLPVQMLLISQPGDQDRFFGLYEILQTLDVIPPEGPRERTADHFTIEGLDGERHAFVEAWAEGGEIKGYALIWIAGDEERFTRLLAEIRPSFTRLPGVLDPAVAPPGEDQAIDLVSGLAVRQPLRTRTGFFVSEDGAVLTSAGAVAGCGEVTIGSTNAEVIGEDAALGLAVLAPRATLAPLSVASFQTGVPLIGAEVAVAGFPFGGVLATPALTFGELADIRGLNGEDTLKRLSLSAEEGDAGGPVFDKTGAVLGMLAEPAATGGTQLPADVSFLVETDAILPVLDAAGVPAGASTRATPMSPEMLTRHAGDVAVLVSCWE
ncbi:trypsin-like peptidase domain-containing protein [Pseudoroseicyclus sp. CXY001]|uniref:trypsin-like peptidase domain-containing protein n=1 Tax=Pseudoroseicyclus sp. CXY001 TaxID=3242492 RepID=UPI00358DADC7